MRTRPVSLRGLLEAAAGLTLVVSAAVSFDVEHAWWQLFTHFRLQYLGTSLALVALLLLLRHRRAAFLALLAAGINAGYVLPWYVGDADVGGQPFKLVQANVLSSNENHEALIALVDSENPDVVVLEEVTAEWAEAVATLANDYPYRYVIPRSDNFGIALLSRAPFVNVRHFASPPLGHPTIQARIDWHGKYIDLIASHPTVPVNPVVYAARNRQFENLAALVAESEGPVVLVGDLNATPWDRHYRRLEETTGLRNARRGFGIVPTWPTFLPLAMIPIDHVLVSADIGVRALTAGPDIGSDHLPLVVTLAL